MHEALAGFPVVVEQVVDWGDMDSFRHVNNVVYFRYFENVRVVYFERLDWMNYLKETGIGPIVATAQARFRKAVTFPDTLLAGVRVSAMSADRYTMDYRLVSTRGNELVTLGDTVVVTFDYGRMQKTPIPDELRRRIEAIEGRSFGIGV